MNILFYGCLLTFSAFIIHLIIWRIRKPDNHTKAILEIFLLNLGCGLLILLSVHQIPALLKVPLPAYPWEYFHLVLFYVSVMAAYLATYPAIEVASPSLIIMEMIVAAGPKGVRQEELYNVFNAEKDVYLRIQELDKGRFIKKQEGCYVLTTRGKWLARLFIAFRKMIHEKEKGG